MFDTKIFQNFVSFRRKIACFGFVSLRINFLNEEFCFVLKSKQFCFVMRSKPNREMLDSFRVTNMLYTRATLNSPSDHLPWSHDFSKEDDVTGE